MLGHTVVLCGVGEKRSDGKFPAHDVTTYVTLGMSVPTTTPRSLTKVTGSLDRFGGRHAGWSVPTSSAITQARKRLGR